MKEKNNINRRDFVKRLGLGLGMSATALAGCRPIVNKDISDQAAASVDVESGSMTYRENSNTGDKVSILGYGMMRLPYTADKKEIDQDAVNELVDYALAHGVNYFDTSPAYCKGDSERATGIALSRHPRDSYYIATKLSNFAPETWPYTESVKMFENSLKELQTEYVDYLLLHAIGMGGWKHTRADMSTTECWNI